MKYEIIAINFSTNQEFVVSTLESMEEVVPEMLRLMHENPDCRYNWRAVDDSD